MEINNSLFSVRYLEIHAAHTCNLFCSSCSHFSQHHVGGIVKRTELINWLNCWTPKIQIGELVILGGEPTLNPELSEILSDVRSLLPSTKLILRTNGFFLENHSDLSMVLRENNVRVEITLHSNSEAYLTKYLKILDHIATWKGVSIGLINHIQGTSYKPWTQRYLGSKEKLRPFDHQNPRKSWEICPGKTCLTLFDKKLWKCPPIAYIRLLEKKYQLSNDWNPYLAYQGLDSQCEDWQLKRFLEAEEEKICGMCPSESIEILKPDPLNEGL